MKMTFIFLYIFLFRFNRINSDISVYPITSETKGKEKRKKKGKRKRKGNRLLAMAIFCQQNRDEEAKIPVIWPVGTGIARLKRYLNDLMGRYRANTVSALPLIII